MLLRRSMLLGATSFLLTRAAQAAPTGGPITIYTLEGCPCCKGWVTHMRRAGYVPMLQVVPDVVALSSKRGIKPEHSSCHMGVVQGYALLGHIPPADVDRLLRERPKALGLSVPGMPLGSPGMENREGVVDRYETLLLFPGGKTKIFARHG